jgi:hypothetical protein
MSSNGADFSDFFSAPVAREFFPSEAAEAAGKSVTVYLNLDFLTIEKMEQLETEFNDGVSAAAGIIKKVEEVEPAKPKSRSTKLAVVGKKPLKKMKTAELLAKAAELDLDIPDGATDEEIIAEIELSEIIPFEFPRIPLFAFEKNRFRFFARTLAGEPGNTDPNKRLLHGWGLVDKDKQPVPISYESFVQMPPHGLHRLYRFVIGEANNPTPQEKKA